MLRLASDENVNGDVLSGLRRLLPELDLKRVQDELEEGTPDPLVLEWAAREGRVLISGDRATMIGYAWDRVKQGLPMPGLFALKIEGGPTLFDHLHLAVECCTPEDCANQVRYFPL